MDPSQDTSAVSGDVGHQLPAVVQYTDGHGPGKPTLGNAVGCV